MSAKNDELRQRGPKNCETMDNFEDNHSNVHPNDEQEKTTPSQQHKCRDFPVEDENITCYKSAAEYSRAVHQWLVQYHMWNQMNWFYMTFPIHAMNMNMMQHMNSSGAQTNGFQNSAFSGFQVPPAQTNLTGNQRQFQPGQVPNGQAAPNVTNEVPRGEEFKIPKLWKRVMAEFIDFFLLFVVKLAVTIFFVEYVGLVDLRHYDLEYLMTTDMDYNTAFAMTSELVAMEIVNRIFICIFETLCLRQGMAGSVGGTTPGKRMMGLKVISCREVISLQGNKILVIPAGNIGTWNAFVRSIIKNFSLAFFFPVCLTVFFFQHNRAAYDIISNSIVVQAHEVNQRVWR